jgi:hypothetical protein
MNRFGDVSLKDSWPSVRTDHLAGSVACHVRLWDITWHKTWKSQKTPYTRGPIAFAALSLPAL